jgi:hypothetical protein
MQKVPLIVVIVLVCRSIVYSEDGPTIHSRDISACPRAVIGSLGLPLGTVVDVVGKWDRQTGKPGGTLKSERLVFTVSSANGKALEDSVDFHARFVRFVDPTDSRDLPDNSSVRYRVFEGLETEGIPDDAYEYDSPVAKSFPFGIYSTLHIVTNLSGKASATREVK